MSTTQQGRPRKKLGAITSSRNGRQQQGRVDRQAPTQVIVMDAEQVRQQQQEEARRAAAEREPRAQTAQLPAVGDQVPEQAQGTAQAPRRPRTKAEARWEKREAQGASYREFLEGLPEHRRAVKAARPLSEKQQNKEAWKAYKEQFREHKALQGLEKKQGGSLTQAQSLRLMQLDMGAANDKYMQSLADADLFVEGFTPEKQEKTVNLHQKLYVKSMVLAGVAPLARGVNPRSVVQSLGMMTAMALLSKDFREEVGSYFKPVKDAIDERREARVRKKGGEAHFRVDKHNEMIDRQTRQMIEADPSLGVDPKFKEERDALRMDTGDVLTKKWDKRLKKLEFAERGHREPYTAQSAALTEMGITMNAYRRLREPGVSGDEQRTIYKGYQAMVQKVRNDAASDGVDGEEMNQAQKLMIGQMMEENPLGIAQVYNGLAQGKYEKGDPIDVKIKGTDEVRNVWFGDFKDHRGHKIPEDLMFTLRAPYGRIEHENQMGEVMAQHMEHTLSKKGMDGYTHEDLGGYIMGWKVHERNMASLANGGRGGFENHDIPESMKPQIMQAQMMISAMASDGIDFEEQRLAYSNSFVDAVKTMRDKHPEMALAWDKQYGERWSERMTEALKDPEGFFEEERRAEHVFVGGSDGFERVRVFPRAQSEPTAPENDGPAFG